MELLNRTEKLLLQNEKNWELYLSNREEAKPFDFYKDMKPFVDEAKNSADAFRISYSVGKQRASSLFRRTTIKTSL